MLLYMSISTRHLARTQRQDSFCSCRSAVGGAPGRADGRMSERACKPRRLSRSSAVAASKASRSRTADGRAVPVWTRKRNGHEKLLKK